MMSLVLYIILIAIAFYPNDNDVQRANEDLVPILNDSGEMDVGLSVIISSAKVNLIFKKS